MSIDTSQFAVLPAASSTFEALLAYFAFAGGMTLAWGMGRKFTAWVRAAL